MHAVGMILVCFLASTAAYSLTLPRAPVQLATRRFAVPLMQVDDDAETPPEPTPEPTPEPFAEPTPSAEEVMPEPAAAEPAFATEPFATEPFADMADAFCGGGDARACSC